MGDTTLRPGSVAVAHESAIVTGHAGGRTNWSAPCAECRTETGGPVGVLIAPDVAFAEQLATEHTFCSVSCLIAWSTRLGGGTPA